MRMEETAEKVLGALSKVLQNKRKITLNSSLADDLEMDSFMAVELLFELEDQYNIEIPDEEIENFKTVTDIIQYLENRLGNSTS